MWRMMFKGMGNAQSTFIYDWSVRNPFVKCCVVCHVVILILHWFQICSHYHVMYNLNNDIYNMILK